MKKFNQVASQVGQASSKPKWDYNEVPIREDDIEYMRVELWDNAPGLAPVHEPKRYRTCLNLYYKKPTDMNQVKKPDHRLWSYMSAFHTFRNNQYKDVSDPHAEWYSNAVTKAKDLNFNYGKDGVVAHGCLGAVKNHTQGNGGYGPHNQPRYTVDMIHVKQHPETPILILHIKDETIEIELRDQPQKNKDRTLYSGEVGA